MPKARAVKKPRHRAPERVQTQPKAALIRVPAAPLHRYDLNAEQVELIKRTIAKGATDDELQLFLWVAKRHRLDPFTRQLHLVKRNDTASGQQIATIQVGIDGYRQMASRYPDFGSVSEAEYGAMQTVGKTKVPEWAKVRVYKKGLAEPTVGVAYWDEYAPPLEYKQSFMWRKMPRHMLAKCAEAIALRKAYPDLADIYTDEEMHRTDSEYTPEGRRMKPVEQLTEAEEAELNPHLKAYLESENQYTPAQKKVIAARLAESSPVLQRAEPEGAERPQTATPAAPSVTYTFLPGTELYELRGPEELLRANRELFKTFWDSTAKALLANASQLGKLIAECERRKIPIRAAE